MFGEISEPYHPIDWICLSSSNQLPNNQPVHSVHCIGASYFDASISSTNRWNR